MATIVYDTRYIGVDEKEAKSVKASDLFVKIKIGGSDSGEERIVKLTDLVVLKKDDPNAGDKDIRKVKGLADFQAQLKKGKVWFRGDASFKLDELSVISYQNETSLPQAPKTFETRKYNVGAPTKETVSKRNLEVAENGDYFFVKVAGSRDWEFVHKEELFIGDPTFKKKYSVGDNVSAGLMDSSRRYIEAIYTEKTYQFVSEASREVVNLTSTTKRVATKIDGLDIFAYLPPYTKAMISNETGAIIGEVEKLNQIISDQKFDKVEEVIDGKKKVKPIVRVKNYEIVSTTPSVNDYISVTIEGLTRLVQVKDLRDLNNNPIQDITKMTNKAVQLVSGETCSALTYEQTHMAYQPIKSYQEISSPVPTENSCLRLSDGRHVNEISSVQPLSYRIPDGVVNEDYIDKYLVSIDDKWVVVDKEYYATNSNFDRNKSIPLIKCDFNSKDCAVVQTKTTKGGGVPEPCSIVKTQLVKDITNNDITLEADENSNKSIVLAGFQDAYKKGEYEVDGVYINGEHFNLEKNSKRYVYTDEYIMDDLAAESFGFGILKSKDITCKDGKIAGGLKFNTGKFMSSAFKLWGKALLANMSIIPLAGFFIPILAPLASLSAIATCIALPLIPVIGILATPILNIINKIGKAIIPDKVEKQRSLQLAQVTTQMKELRTKFEKTDVLNPTQFETAYADLMQRINSFGQTINANQLVVKDGVAKIDQSNGRFAQELIAKRNKELTKKLKDLKKERKAIKKQGGDLTAIDKEIADIEKELKSVKDGTYQRNYEAHAKLQDMQKRAGALKLFIYINNYRSHMAPDAASTPQTKEWIAKFEKDFKPLLGLVNIDAVTYSDEKGLMYGGVSIFEDEKKIKKKLKGSDLDIWLETRGYIVDAIERVQTLEIPKPINAEVGSIAEAKELLDKEYANIHSLATEIKNLFSAIPECSMKDSLKTDLSAAVQKIQGIGYNGTEIANMEKANDMLIEVRDAKSLLETIKDKSSQLNDLFAKRTKVEGEFKEVIAKFELDKAGKSLQIQKILEPRTQQLLQKNLETQIAFVLESLQKSSKSVVLNEIADFYAEIENANKEMGELFVEVQNEIIYQDVKTIKDNLQTRINDLMENNSTAKTMLGTAFASTFNVSEEMTKLVKSLEKSDSKEKTQEIIDRARKLSNIADNAILAFSSYEKLKGDVVKVGAVTWLDDIRKLLTGLDASKATVEELDQKAVEVRAIYEKIKVLEPKAKTTSPDPKAPARKNADFIRENAVVAQLEDSNSSVYKEILRLLEEGKFALTEDAAKDAIFQFVFDTNACHNNSVSVKTMFEQNPVYEYILTQGSKIMGKLITMDY